MSGFNQEDVETLKQLKRAQLLEKAALLKREQDGLGSLLSHAEAIVERCESLAQLQEEVPGSSKKAAARPASTAAARPASTAANAATKRKRRDLSTASDADAVHRRAAAEKKEDESNLRDLKWFARNATVVEFDSRTGRPVRNGSFFRDDAAEEEDMDPIEGLVKLSHHHIPSELLDDLTAIHDHIVATVTKARMVSWSGVGGEWDGRLRAFGFPTRRALQALDGSPVRLRAFEKAGADADEDERANRAALCILDETLPRKDGAVPFRAAQKICNALRPAGLDPPGILAASQLVAYQPNLHNGAAFLKPHLDQPLHEGFGKIIVTVAIRGGGATIVLLDRDESAVDDATGERYQRSWRFHLCEGEAYVLSGSARNLCLHGVLADDDDGDDDDDDGDSSQGAAAGTTTTTKKCTRESLNVRFGLHSLEEAQADIFDHWDEGECPHPEDCVPFNSSKRQKN